MRLTAILLLALLPALAGAGAIYRHTDAKGNVVYTDQPPEGAGAEEVDLPPLNTVSGGVVSGAASASGGEESTPAAGPATFAGYSSLEIQGVGNGALLQNPEGSLSISASPDPGLQDGHKILLSYDGKLVSDTGSYAVPTLDRGQHTVTAEVVDQDGRSLIQAKPVTFDVQQHFIQKKPVHH